MKARLSPFVALSSTTFLLSFLALPGFADNWGENRGEMTWGEAIAAVPLTGKVGLCLLVWGDW